MGEVNSKKMLTTLVIFHVYHEASGPLEWSKPRLDCVPVSQKTERACFQWRGNCLVSGSASATVYI